MNKIFATAFSDQDIPLDAQQRTTFITSCSEFLDRLIADLTKESECFGNVISLNSKMTHDYQRFAYGFDPEDENTPVFGFISALASVGQMGITMCTLFQQYKEELDGLLRSATAMRERFKAYPAFAKRAGVDSPAAKSLFESLKLDFISDILDHCIRNYDMNFEFCKNGCEVLKPFMDKNIPCWTSSCCAMQKKSFAVRNATPPNNGDALLTRGTVAPIFGTPLKQLQLVPGYGIPQILFDTSEAILNNPAHLKTEGIFRVGCSAAALSGIKSAYDKGVNVVVPSLNVHLITSLMKSWLRELPDSVIPAKIAVKFCANAGADPRQLKENLSLLPEVNRRCLHKVMEVGVRVSQYSSFNMMTADNVARIFGPNIIRREDELNPLTQVANLITLAHNFIANYDIIFGPFCKK